MRKINSLLTKESTLTQIEWLTSTEFAKRYRISRNRLKDLRDQQVLVAGIHYIMFGSHRLYDAAACDKAVREHSKARAKAVDGEPYCTPPPTTSTSPKG